MQAWSSFMDKYYPDGDKADGNTVFGYAAAETLIEVLKQCGDDLSRENIMRQAEALKNFRSSLALPGIVINTGPADFRPIEQMRLVQFDGNTWQPIGEVLESAFLGTTTDRETTRVARQSGKPFRVPWLSLIGTIRAPFSRS